MCYTFCVQPISFVIFCSKHNKKMKRTGLSGIFAASLELTKEGDIQILQKNVFKEVMIKRNTNQ